MVCPYCNIEIQSDSPFCPHCGQSIQSAGHLKGTDTYWKNVSNEQAENYDTYKSTIDESQRAINSKRMKKRIAAAVLAILIAGVSLGIFRYQQFNSQMVFQVRNKLIGRTLTATSDHMEGLGFLYYEYWQLTFTDDQNVRYAYIETAGPAEADEDPRYQGTYHYTLTRSITGKYTILVNGETYELSVNNNNEPVRISR